jgi:small subunit ribosomal protein S1
MSLQLGRFQPGDIVTGKIIRLEPTGILVDFNTNQLIHVPLFELSLNDIQTPEEALQLNEIREFIVVGNYDGKSDIFFSNCSPDNIIDSDRLCEAACDEITRLCGHPVSQENIILHTKIIDAMAGGVSIRLQWFMPSENHPPTVSVSIRQLELKKAWERVRQLQAEGAIISTIVLKKNSRNALVKIECLYGSVQTHVDKHRDELIEGKELPLTIIEVREDLNRLVLLHYPVWLRLKNLHVGQIVSGKVILVKDYGVWADVGDLPGLLPAASILNSSIEHPNQVFNVGDHLEAVVVDIDITRGSKVVLGALENEGIDK